VLEQGDHWPPSAQRSRIELSIFRGFLDRTIWRTNATFAPQHAFELGSLRHRGENELTPSLKEALRQRENRNDPVDRCCWLRLSSGNFGGSNVTRADISAGQHNHAGGLWLRPWLDNACGSMRTQSRCPGRPNVGRPQVGRPQVCSLARRCLPSLVLIRSSRLSLSLTRCFRRARRG
jgi:hypothetical protein